MGKTWGRGPCPKIRSGPEYFDSGLRNGDYMVQCWSTASGYFIITYTDILIYDSTIRIVLYIIVTMIL